MFIIVKSKNHSLYEWFAYGPFHEFNFIVKFLFEIIDGWQPNLKFTYSKEKRSDSFTFKHPIKKSFDSSEILI